MRFRSKNTPLVMQLERLVRGKGIAPPPYLRALQVVPPPTMTWYHKDLINFTSREERLKIKFIEKYPSHGEEVVSATPTKTNYVANEFVKKQIKLMNSGMSESMAFRVVEGQFLKEISEVGDRTDLLYQQMQKNMGRNQFEKTKKKTQVSRFNVDFIRSQRFKQFYEKQMGWVKVEKPVEGNEFEFDNLVAILAKKKGVNEESNNNKSNKNNNKSKGEEGKGVVEAKDKEKEKEKSESKKEMKKDDDEKEDKTKTTNKKDKDEKTKKEMKKEKGSGSGEGSKDKISGKESKKKEKKTKSKSK